MNFADFFLFIYSDAGRAVLGAAAWRFTGWLVVYIAMKRHLPDIGNDDKRLISLGVVVLVTVVVQLAALAGGYAHNTIEEWFRVISEIGMTGVVIFALTKKIEGTSPATPPAAPIVQ